MAKHKIQKPSTKPCTHRWGSPHPSEKCPPNMHSAVSLSRRDTDYNANCLTRKKQPFKASMGVEFLEVATVSVVELNSFCCSATASSCQIFILALSSTTSASMCCENAVSTTRLPQVISSLSSPWSMSLSWNFQQFHLPAASHVEACSFEYAVCVKKIVTSSLETLKECFFCPYCLT